MDSRRRTTLQRPGALAPSHSNILFVLVIPILAILSGWIAISRSAEEGIASGPNAAPWVRTAEGWERAHWLVEREPPYAPPVHPAPVALGILLSGAGLLGFASAARRPTAPAPTAIQIATEDRL